MKIFSVEEMVAAEKAADAAGWSYDQMMEIAGKSVADAIMARTEVADKGIMVLVGPGNNGGDGLVAARYLAEAGAEVSCYLFKERDSDRDTNLAQIQQLELSIFQAEHDMQQRILHHRLQLTDIVVDALLGTGVTRPIRGDLAQLMRRAASAIESRSQTLAEEHRPDLHPITGIHSPPPKPMIVAVDCPSGLNCDTGELDPVAIPADMTVTFAGPKRGHFLFPGAAACGELVVADIGIDPDLTPVAEVVLELMTAERARQLLPARPMDGHKGTFGTVLAYCGQSQYWGAPVLCGKGAYRAGAGLVALAVPSSIRPTVATQLVEATYPPLSATDTLDRESSDWLANHGGRIKSVLVGPGIGQANDFLRALLDIDSLPPMILDADALNILSETPDWPDRLPDRCVLTPHPGEMARLCKFSAEEYERQSRVALTREKATSWSQVVLLKGAYTVIAAPDGRATLLPFANPAMAVGGSGDVLSGVIAALLAQGLPPYEAAVLGGYLHGVAGQLAQEMLGSSGVLAGDLAEYVPLARRRILHGQGITMKTALQALNPAPALR